jgi:uncharacterized protein (TIGR02147 family)
MILSGSRPLSVEGLRKLMPALNLTSSERRFMEAMHTLGTTTSQDERIESLRRMKKYSGYRKNNPQEAEVYEYLTQWYYYTIRELTGEKDFKLEAEWIQNRLRVHVPLHEIKEAIEFLVKNKYIEVDSDDKVQPPLKHLNCQGGVYKVALTQYHKQIFQLAEKSIENADPSERYILGHTFSISMEKYETARALIDEVIQKIQTLSQGDENMPKEAVYHMEMALFPLTKNIYKRSKE